jgi:hypothetical protein
MGMDNRQGIRRVAEGGQGEKTGRFLGFVVYEHVIFPWSEEHWHIVMGILAPVGCLVVKDEVEVDIGNVPLYR